MLELFSMRGAFVGLENNKKVLPYSLSLSLREACVFPAAWLMSGLIRPLFVFESSMTIELIWCLLILISSCSSSSVHTLREKLDT